MPTVMLAIILVMSGFNSVALVIVADPGAQPEDITVTVDLADLLTELPVCMQKSSPEIPEDIQPPGFRPQKGEYGLCEVDYPSFFSQSMQRKVVKYIM